MIPGIAPAIVRLLGGGGDDPLAEFYGTDPGDIVIDWDFSDSSTITVAENGTISGVVNKGGWGATYNLGPSSGTSLLYDPAGFALANGGKSGLRIGAVQVDFYGLHALTSIAGDQHTVMARGYDNPAWGCGVQFEYGRVAVGLGGQRVYVGTALGASDLIEYEVRPSVSGYDGYAAGGVRSIAFSGSPNLNYEYVGATSAQGTPVDRIRRIVLVKQHPDHDMADPEPAVLAAREWLEADADAYNDGL